VLTQADIVESALWPNSKSGFAGIVVHHYNQRPRISAGKAVAKNLEMKRRLIVLLISLLAVPLLRAGEVEPVKPGPKDKCPVCGMFVAKYPDFLAEIIYTDGTIVFFDGVKDLMKYYLNLKKYQPQKTPDDVESIYVNDYYRLEFIDARSAFYVAGSDVYGPMGKELIPFEKKTEAEQFIKDHRANAILTFREIDLALVKSLD